MLSDLPCFELGFAHAFHCIHMRKCWKLTLANQLLVCINVPQALPFPARYKSRYSGHISENRLSYFKWLEAQSQSPTGRQKSLYFQVIVRGSVVLQS